MGAARRQWRAIERAQMKDAARRVREVRRQEAAESEAVAAEALRMADSFAEPSGLVQTKDGLTYVLASELADGE